jgi:hypothetical protein
MPVPIIAPMPSMVSWKAPNQRCSDFFSAVARMTSSDFTRSKIMSGKLSGQMPLTGE